MARRDRKTPENSRVLRLETGNRANKAQGSAEHVGGKRYRLVETHEGLPALVEPFAPATEQFRLLRTRLDSVLPHRTDGGHVVVVTSAMPGEGKTTCSVNTAIVAAQEVGQRILLVECDLRSPSVLEYLHEPPARGLSDVLQGKVRLEDVVCPMVAPANLDIILAGRPSTNPVGLLGSPAMATLIAAFRRDYDLVIVDTPPSLHFADAAEIAPLTDGYLLVARSGKTMREPLVKTHRRLSAHRILGVVFNDIPATQTAMYYAYYSQRSGRGDGTGGGGGR